MSKGGNQYHEKWTEDEAIRILEDAIKLANSKEGNAYTYDFIGEVARDMGYYKEIFTYLKDKFKSCKPLHRQLVSTLESNCFYNSKKGNIKEATAIVNLKSNHNWTDRVEQKHDIPTGEIIIQSKGKIPEVE